MAFRPLEAASEDTVVEDAPRRGFKPLEGAVIDEPVAASEGRSFIDTIRKTVSDFGSAVTERLPQATSNVLSQVPASLQPIVQAQRRLFNLPAPTDVGMFDRAAGVKPPAPESVIPGVKSTNPGNRMPGSEIGPPREPLTAPGAIADAARRISGQVTNPVAAPVVRGVVGAVDQLYGQGEGVARLISDATGMEKASDYFSQSRVERDAAAGNVRPLGGLPQFATEAVQNIVANAPFYWMGMGPLKNAVTPTQVATMMESFAVTKAPTLAMAIGSGGSSYNDPARAHLSGTDRLASAASDAFWEYLGEQLGFGETIKALKTRGMAGEALTQRLKALAGESLGEGITEVGQIDNRMRMGITPDMTPSQILANVAQAAVMGAVVSGGMQAAGAAGSRIGADRRLDFTQMGQTNTIADLARQLLSDSETFDPGITSAGMRPVPQNRPGTVPRPPYLPGAEGTPPVLPGDLLSAEERILGNVRQLLDSIQPSQEGAPLPTISPEFQDNGTPMIVQGRNRGKFAGERTESATPVALLPAPSQVASSPDQQIRPSETIQGRQDDTEAITAAVRSIIGQQQPARDVTPQPPAPQPEPKATEYTVRPTEKPASAFVGDRAAIGPAEDVSRVLQAAQTPAFARTAEDISILRRYPDLAQAAMTPGFQRSAEQTALVKRAEQETKGQEDRSLDDQTPRAQTETPKFKRWFGESKAVGADGTPLVVYHGTGSDFDAFAENERGIFFAEDPGAAAPFSRISRGGEPRIVPAFLSIRNPWTMIRYGDDVPYSKMVDQSVKALKAKGYDGTHDPTTGVWTVFSPKQIKSAIGNNGAFDPNSDRIVDDRSFNREVSTRVPTAKPRGKNAPVVENPLTDRLQVGLEAFRDVPEAFKNAVDLLTGYVNWRPNPQLRGPDARAEKFISDVVDNLLWLHDQVPAEIRARSKKWYDGANVIANMYAERYDVTPAQAAAVLAVNSPQTEWFTNVSRAERILDIWSKHQDTAWSKEMNRTANRIFGKEQYAEDLAQIKGKTLGDLSGDSVLQAMWIRAYDESHNNRNFRIVTPEGTFGDFVKTGKGENATTAWASLAHIAKSIEVLQDGSLENISRRLGNEHKVRSFYNNIFSPNDAVGDVTIDTHAVAAGLLRPLSGSSLEVTHNLGAGISNALKGLSGTYGIYAEAYRRAAKERGVLPREMQSITWEAIRGLYTGPFKKSSAKAKLVEAAWKDYRAGKLTEAQVRERITALAGGINEPNWWQSDRLPSRQTWTSSYGGELSPVRVPGRGGETDSGRDQTGSGGGGARVQSAQGRRADDRSASRVTTANGTELGFKSPKNRDAVRALNPQQRFDLEAALEELGPTVAPPDVIAGLKFASRSHPSNGSFWPDQNVVTLSPDRLDMLRSNDPLDRADAMHTLAHEIAHAVDFAANKGQRDAVSMESGRLASMWSGQPAGDLFVEAYDAWLGSQIRDDLQRVLSYPLDALFNGMSDKTMRLELFAQVSALYNTNLELVRDKLPTWATTLEQIYGNPETGEGAPQSADEVSQRLREALSNEGAGARAEERVPESQTDRSANAVGPGPARGPPRPGVGTPPRAGAQPAGQRTVGGGPRGPGAAAGATAGPTWGLNEPSLRDRLLREWQDKFIDVKRVREEMQRAAGLLTEGNNAYLAEELYHGRVSARVNKATRQHIEPLLDAMKATKITADELGRYLWARHAPERNKQMAKVNPGGPGNLSGLYDDAAAAARDGNAGAPNAADIIAGFRGRLGDLNRLAAMVDGITAATRQILVSEGLESQATINAWGGAYKNYVPLFRDTEEASAGQGFKVAGAESKRAMGSQKEAIAILAAVISQHERAIIRAERAKVGRTLVQMAEDNPNPDFWKIDTPPMKRTINPSTGLVQVSTDPLYRQRDDVFIVKDKGPNGTVIERVITFNPSNERAMAIAQAMNNLGVVQLGAVTKIVGRVSRLLANLATSWNPQFWVTNAARDVQTAAVNLQDTELRGRAPQVIANIPKAMAGIISAEKGQGTSQWAQTFRAFQDAGGQTGWMQMWDDLRDRHQAIAKQLDRANRSKLDPREIGHKALEYIELANTAIENAIRVAAFAEARKIGLTDKRAASIAKNMTVNFNRKGNRSVAANAWYMFFNASVQGTARLVQAIATSRRARLYSGMMVAFSAALEIMNRMLWDDDRDPEGNVRYELIPEYVRQKNMIFMLPDGKHVAIPLPYGFNVFHSAGRLMAEAILTASGSSTVQERRKPSELAWAFTQTVMDSFVPLGSAGSPLQYAAPTIADPFVQYLENKTFFGSPMRPEPLPMSGPMPDYKQYFRSTSDTAKDLARWLSTTTGGDERQGGAIDISPTTIEHIVKTATGGTGQFGLVMLDFSRHVIDRALGEAEPEDYPARRIPFVGKFYGEVDDRDMAGKYYRLREDATKSLKLLKAYQQDGDLEAAAKVEDEKGPLIAMAREISSQQYRRSMSEIRKQFQALDGLPADERAKERRMLQRDEATLMARALRAYNEAQESAR